MPRPEKVTAVAEIAERFKGVDAALLTEYRGLSVSEIAEVRGALREAGAEYRVLKNTLARLAVREVGLEELVGMLEGPTAVAFCGGDAVDAAKALEEAAKKFPVITIKGGLLNGQVLDSDQAQALAKLETREVQLTKIAIMLNAPIQQTANVLSALLRDLGSMLTQVIAQKEEAGPAEVEAPAAEAPAEAEAPAAEAAVDEAPAPEAEAPAEEAPAPAEAVPDTEASEVSAEDENKEE